MFSCFIERTPTHTSTRAIHAHAHKHTCDVCLCESESLVQADAVQCQFILSFQDGRNEVHEMHQGQVRAGNESNESNEGSGRAYEFHVECSLKYKTTLEPA